MNRIEEGAIRQFKLLQSQISSAAAASKSAKDYSDLEPYQHMVGIFRSKLEALSIILGIDKDSLEILPPVMGTDGWNTKSELQILKICADTIELSLIKEDEIKLEQKEFLIDSGKALTANTLISQILSSATKSLKIVDNYLSDESAKMIESATNSKISVQILTTDYSESKAKLFLQKVQIIKRAWQSTFEVKKTHKFHDRFIIIDDSRVWFSGPSIDSLGIKKPGVICELTDIKGEIIRNFNEVWEASDSILIEEK